MSKRSMCGSGHSDTALRDLVYNCLLSCPRPLWKGLLRTLIRGAPRKVLVAVQADATAAGVWRDEISRWQRPPVFRHIMSFVDWRTQWVGVERVCKGWRESCADVGGCAVASFPTSTTSENLRVAKRHHRGVLQLNLNECPELG